MARKTKTATPRWIAENGCAVSTKTGRYVRALTAKTFEVGCGEKVYQRSMPLNGANGALAKVGPVAVNLAIAAITTSAPATTPEPVATPEPKATPKAKRTTAKPATAKATKSAPKATPSALDIAKRDLNLRRGNLKLATMHKWSPARIKALKAEIRTLEATVKAG